MLLTETNPHGGATDPATLDFSVNVNPYGAPEPVLAALQEAVRAPQRYPDPTCAALREALSAYEGVPAKHILCGNGASELIYAFAYALDRKKPALVVAPTFLDYERALAAAQVPLLRSFLSPEEGFMPSERLFSCDFHRMSAVFLCSPNNPTGRCVPPPLLWRLLRTGVRVLCDLTFLDLTLSPGRYDLPALIRTYPNLVVLRAFTKSFALAGVRLGYALCTDASFLEKMAQKTPCWNVSAPAQAAGIAAAGCKGYPETCAVQIAAERARFMHALQEFGLEVFPGEANFLLTRSQIPLCEGLLARGIQARSCANFPGLDGRYVRFAIRTPKENDRLLAALSEITKEHPI